jgi:purine-binding chemotaxis protein CheW
MNNPETAAVAHDAARNVNQKQMCTFILDDHLLGVEVGVVQEVLRYQPMTPVPLSPSVVAGLINLRGQIVTAIDLRKRLELEDRPEGTRPMNVVITTDESPVSLLVDRIGDVIDVTEVPFELPPDTVKGVARELITGAYKLDGRLLLVLDVARAIETNELVGAIASE